MEAQRKFLKYFMEVNLKECCVDEEKISFVTQACKLLIIYQKIFILLLTFQHLFHNPVINNFVAFDKNFYHVLL